jgi:hypothetical protein
MFGAKINELEACFDPRKFTTVPGCSRY